MTENDQQDLPKYAEIRAFSDPHFPAYGQNCTRIFPYLDRISDPLEITEKYGYDSAHIRENTDQRKPVFRHISHSERIGVECLLLKQVCQ